MCDVREDWGREEPERGREPRSGSGCGWVVLACLPLQLLALVAVQYRIGRIVGAAIAVAAAIIAMAWVFLQEESEHGSGPPKCV